MAKSSKIVSFYESAARDLKKLGVVSYPDIKNLSPQQKGRITRLMGVRPPEKTWKSWTDEQKARFRRDAKFGEAVNHPEKFHIANVSKKVKNELKQSGFLATPKKSKVIIPLHSSERGEFTKAKIVTRKNKKRGTFTHIVMTGPGIRETITPSNAANFHDKLNELAKKKLKNNQMVTIKIGDNATFNTRFDNVNDLYKYMKEDMKIKDTTAEALARYMSIVEVETAKQKSMRENPEDYTDYLEQQNNGPTRNSGKTKAAPKITRKNPKGK